MSTPFQAPERQGHLSDVFLPGILCRLHRLSFTGTVQVRNGPVAKSVYFRHGQILSAASNDEVDRLSTILLNDKLLTRDQLEMAQEKARPGASLGRSLVELGFVSRHQLMETARSQVRSILESLFGWSGGEYKILEDQVPASVPNLGMRTEKLLFDALLGSSNREAVLSEIGGMDRKFRPSTVSPIEWRQWGLGEDAERVLRGVNGVRTVNHIAGEIDLDDFSVVKILCCGLHLGVIEAPEEEPAVTAEPEEPESPPPEPAAETTAATAEPSRPEEPVVVDESPAPGMDLPPEAAPGPIGPPTPPAEESIPPSRDEVPPPAVEAESAGDADSEPAAAIASGPEPIATVEMAAPPVPEPPAAVLTGPEAAAPGTDLQAPVSTPVEDRPPMPPEEGPFHGFVDTSAETETGPGSGKGRRGGSRWFAIGGILVGAALVVFSIAVWSSRGSTEPDPAAEAVTESPVAVAEPDTDAGVPAGPPADAAGGPGEPEEPPPEAIGTPAVASGLDTDRPQPEPVAAEPAPSQPEATPAAPAQLQNAREALASGDFHLAAARFQAAVSAAPQDFTLQVLLACRPSTVAGLMPPPDDFYLLPQRFKGKDCYRLCWGRFPSRSAALAAIQRLPEPLARLNGKPFPLAFAKVLPVTGTGTAP